MVHVEIYIDLWQFHWGRFRAGYHDPEIQSICGKICESLSVWQRSSIKRQNYCVTIRDNNQFISPLLRLSFWDAIKALVGFETILIIFVKYKIDLRKLWTLLAPSLGPSTIHNEWPVTKHAKSNYHSIKFHSRKSLADRSGQTSGK